MKNLIATLVIGISAAQLMGGVPQKNSVADEKNSASSNVALPAALIGQWQSGSLSAEKFYNPSTQQWDEPAGRGIFLIVQANGDYRFGGGEKIANLQYFVYQEGKVAVQDSQLQLSPQAGSEYTRDASASQCAASQRELQASTFKFQVVQDARDGRATKLLLTDEHGEVVTLLSSAR